MGIDATWCLELTSEGCKHDMSSKTQLW